MIKVLGSHREAPLSVSEIAEQLRISQPTATKHLRILLRAGLVSRDEARPRVHYALRMDTLVECRRQCRRRSKVRPLRRSKMRPPVRVV
ncbi:helix-turn-helix domain-containing protein [Branchiibius hedensis]